MIKSARLITLPLSAEALNRLTKICLPENRARHTLDLVKALKREVSDLCQLWDQVKTDLSYADEAHLTTLKEALSHLELQIAEAAHAWSQNQIATESLRSNEVTFQRKETHATHI